MAASSAIASALFVSGLSLDASAYRPFDGTDADVAQRRVVEVELGPLHYYRLGDRSFLIAPEAVLNFGLFERTEIVVEAEDLIALGRLEPGAKRVGLTGDDVLVKHVFREGTLQGKSGPSVAAEAGVLLPEIEEEDEHGAGASLDVITSYRWSWGTLHWNEMVAFTREHHADLFSGIILEGPAEWHVRPVAEVFFDEDFAGDATGSLLVGAIWTAAEDLSIDAGFRGARVGAEYASEARFGLTWAIPLGAHAPAPSVEGR